MPFDSGLRTGVMQFADLILQHPILGHRNDLFLGPRRRQRTLVRQPTPGEQLVGRNPMPPGNQAHARLIGLRDNRQLLRRRPPTPPLGSRKDLTLRYRTSHRHDITSTPYGSGRMSGLSRD